MRSFWGTTCCSRSASLRWPALENTLRSSRCIEANMGAKCRRLLYDALTAAAFIYLWVLPQVRARGSLGWGHYRFLDIYLGVPVARIAAGRIVVALFPPASRRAVAMRLVASIGSALVAIFALG